MKFTLAWLKEHLDTAATVEGIAEKLTMIGLEVEKVEDRAKVFAPFRIARVISAEKHPNADRLRVCMVNPGDGKAVQVVCGAPNARAGMIGVFAPVGTRIPGTGVDLEKGVIRGVESNGMLLSERELGLSDNHDGIVDLPADAPVGGAYADYAGLGDAVIDVAVTPNRPDALGVAGIARDLAAAGMGRLIDRPVAPVRGEGACPVGVRLDFAGTPSLCPAFGLRLVRGVRNGPSPEWLQKRLRAIGLRPINALVDITNFITFDRGRPLHVFDAAKVEGDLTVRRARRRRGTRRARREDLSRSIRKSASSPTTNGVESLAGIMGGEASGCSEETTDVLIELALWEPLNIAQTGRRLGIQSDARHRFERGVDPAFMIPGLELATRMVVELCGGMPTDDPRRRRDSRAAHGHRPAGHRGQPDRRHRPVDQRGDGDPRKPRLRLQAAPDQGRHRRLGADLAAGRGAEGRPRRGGRPHHRRRSRAADAAAAGARRREAGADPDPDPHPQGQARRSPPAASSRR